MDQLYYKSGALYSVFQENKKEYFYENGTLKTSESYAMGRLHGPSLLYWPNGVLKRRCHFTNGMRDGLDQMWNVDGALLDEGTYQMGKAVGVHLRFHPTGTLVEEIEYLEAPRFNLRQWDDLGELCVEAIWDQENNYRERAWDRFERKWVEKEGYWDGKKLVYL
jgi:antitoxin component YwqK of YwqJK toxin-antitoxin module